MKEGTETAAASVCRVFDRCTASPAVSAVRDAALLSVYFGAELGPDELAVLRRADYEFPGQLTAPDGRRLQARDGARRCLEDWIWLRGSEPGPLFVLVDPLGSPTRRGCSARDVEAALRHRLISAGIRDVEPGDLRQGYTSPWWSEVPPGGSAREVRRRPR